MKPWIARGAPSSQGEAGFDEAPVRGWVTHLAQRYGGLALDVGTGACACMAVAMARRGLRVDAIDYASGAVRIAQERTAGRLADSLEVHYADGVRLPFPDGSYHDGKLGEIYRPRPETQPCYTDLRAIYAQLYPALKGIHRQASAFRVQYGG